MYSKEQQKAVAAEILQKCIEISNTKKADVFFDYSPHISSIDVYIYRNGWGKEISRDKTMTIYFDWEVKNVDEQIKEVKENLDELLTE